MGDNPENGTYDVSGQHDDRVGFDGAWYEPEDFDEKKVDAATELENNGPPMAIYQPWDRAFGDTDFHIQNPGEDAEIDVYSGHAGTAYAWREDDDITLFYEFDDTILLGAYPEIDEGLASGTELNARKALSEGDQGIAVTTSPKNAETVVYELAELDEALLEEGRTNQSLLLGLEDSREVETALEENEGEFDRHREFYDQKDRLEAS